VRDLAALVILATRAARAGARVHRAGLGREQQVDVKSTPTDLVTEVDREAERVIVADIRAERPDDAVRGEEATDRPGRSGVRWIVDPLDGTTNYVYRYPAFGVSIGVEVDGELAAGVVHDVARDRSTGIVGARRLHQTCLRVRTSRAGDGAVATGFQPVPAVRAWQAGVLARVLPRVRDVRRGGSAAIDLCGVAMGARRALRGRAAAEWDTAAGTAIVRSRRRRADVDRPAALTPLVVAGPRLVEARSCCDAGALGVIAGRSRPTSCQRATRSFI
jgi:myo-inositol-1(or 4)-monophosphatase